MKNILVPVDFSNCSKNALENAISLADKLNMGLVIFHSVMIPASFMEGAPITSMDMALEPMEKKAKADIKELFEEFPALRKISTQTKVQYGPLSDQISGITDEMDIALIVMGTHGSKGLRRTLLGSNAYHVMKKVSCPVIALPEDRNLTQMKQFVFAIDCHETPGHDVITMVVNLTKAYFGELHLVHVDNDMVDQKRQLEVARSMEKYLKSMPHKFHFLHDEDVEKALTDFTLSQDFDLLMLVAKHHGFLDRIRHGSHTKKLISDIPFPIMVLHE